MNKKYPENKLFEELASIEHTRWADWQRYLHSKLKYTEVGGNDGKVEKFYLMSIEYFEHLEKQINTPYSELTDKEKDSDREQVLRYWDLIK